MDDYGNIYLAGGLGIGFPAAHMEVLLEVGCSIIAVKFRSGVQPQFLCLSIPKGSTKLGTSSAT